MARPNTRRTPTIHDPAYRVILSLLREARRAAGVSQGEIATRMGYSRTVISKLERGELRLDLLQLRQYCEAIGVPLVGFVQRFEQALAERGAAS